ncbi:MAG TPA: serine hydrolase [Rhizobiaceae bacterium]|nr:serine hydrolase [Rhizobiaceae bacterium]
MTTDTYHPASSLRWESVTSAEAGFDPMRLEAAVALAQSSSVGQSEGDIETMTRLGCAGEAYTEIIGPMRNRGDHNGMIVRHGRIVAEWGDVRRVDMAFSITKSFLSTVAGLAWKEGLFDFDTPVRHSVPDLFDEGMNRDITWEHLLRQTSAWEGVLWDKPAWAVNKDRVAAGAIGPTNIKPGAAFEYNDVRVNLLAFALLRVWGRPLPQILRERVMGKIGATTTWDWFGYKNSWVNLSGQWVQSVSGGGHWGGGLHISTRDLALWGLLTLREGLWNGVEMLSRDWIQREISPGEANPAYGFVNWNIRPSTDGQPRRPVFYTTGSTRGDAGTTAQNSVTIDRDRDIMIVLRWMNGDRLEEVTRSILRSADD